MIIDKNYIFVRISNSFPGFTLEEKLLLTAVIQQEIIWNDLSKSNDIQKERIEKIDNYNYVKEKIVKEDETY